MKALDEYLQPAIEAALRAGEEILNFYYKPGLTINYKEDKSPVTEADHRACDVIAEVLGNGLPVISEEKPVPDYNERKHWEQYWLVDPLDGTREFVKRNGEFTVNIALIRNNTPVTGVIYAPASGKLYFGSREGAFRINAGAGVLPDPAKFKAESIMARRNAEGNFIVAASRSHLSSSTRRFINQLIEEGNGVQVVGAGSSLKICMVAEGSADCYPRFGTTMEWDIAAGHAIAEAAGAAVLEFPSGEPVRYNKQELKNNWFLISGGNINFAKFKSWQKPL